MGKVLLLRMVGRVSESEQSVNNKGCASLTVVLYGSKHQSQVIYSHPCPRPSLFSLLLGVFVNTKQKNGSG